MEGTLARRTDAALLWCAALAPVGCAVVSAFVFYETGSGGSVRYFMLYAAPLLVAVALWARTRLAIADVIAPITLVVDAVVVAMSLIRFVLGELHPVSGHMLFLTYSLLTTRVGWYRWLAVALIVQTSIYKLVLWRDQQSWALGLVAGVLAAAVVLLAGRRAAVAT